MRRGARPSPPPHTLLSPMASHLPQGPDPTVLEGQELKDTVDNGHDDGERQQVGVGLQEGNLGVGEVPVSPAAPLPGVTAAAQSSASPAALPLGPRRLEPGDCPGAGHWPAGEWVSGSGWAGGHGRQASALPMEGCGETAMG